MASRARITVTGVVQGVGFRPHVYRLAVDAGLSGYVLNNARGVMIEVEGDGAENFTDALRQAPPPLSVIKSIQTEILPTTGNKGFEIRVSEDAPGGFALVSPDVATCPDCVAEISEPAERRYKYPFTNCTNCGPRYSIVRGVPYDRKLTTMAGFAMCGDCSSEYGDPSDRRFHAQPVACPACGPKLEYVGPDGVRGACYGEEALGRAVSDIKAGMVVAIKGLGGFHLACDAGNHAAVHMLRQHKRKSGKPFALMAPDVDTVKRYCEVSAHEEALLSGTVRPIVIMEKRAGAGGGLSPDVAPGSATLGFMLPYTPLHHLLFGMGGERNFDALVMTSGNLSEEPIAVGNDEALGRLSGLADAYLLHDRDIYMRVDDSITRVMGGVPRVLRRARGYVPGTIGLGREMPEVLACGGELKNTFCLTKGSHVIMSQHIGDLAGVEAMKFFEETLANLRSTFRAGTKIVAHDMHPDYLSTRFAAGLKDSPELVSVQHHHAHIAACMAENGYEGRVIGVALDGTGYGTDGNIWGSEFLVADYSGFERFAHIRYIPLPGGDKAVREPWRTAVSCLMFAYGGGAGLEKFLRLNAGRVSRADAGVVAGMVEKGINSPLSSGMGRLFDAVSSVAGLRDVVTYEGEAAIMLEAAAGAYPDETTVYPYAVDGEGPAVLDTAPMIRAVADELTGGEDAGVIARRFHNTVADMVIKTCLLARERHGLDTVALSGGVFQNALLFGLANRGLMDLGFRVLSHSRVPTNDACISLGQAAVAAWKYRGTTQV